MIKQMLVASSLVGVGSVCLYYIISKRNNNSKPKGIYIVFVFSFLNFTIDIFVYSCVNLVESCEPFLITNKQKEYFKKLEDEYPNISKALAKCVEVGNGEYSEYAMRIIGIYIIFILKFILKKCVP